MYKRNVGRFDSLEKERLTDNQLNRYKSTVEHHGRLSTGVCSRKKILEKSLSGLLSGMEQLVNTLLQQLR